MIEPMILPQLRWAGGRHRCHNSGGSHGAMQGERPRDFPSALASSKQRHQPVAAQKQFIGTAMPLNDGSGLRGWNRTVAKRNCRRHGQHSTGSRFDFDRTCSI
jgi:hypothetical protein